MAKNIQADREILYRGLTDPKVIEKTDHNVILITGASPHIWTEEEFTYLLEETDGAI